MSAFQIVSYKYFLYFRLHLSDVFYPVDGILDFLFAHKAFFFITALSECPRDIIFKPLYPCVCKTEDLIISSESVIINSQIAVKKGFDFFSINAA